MTRQRMDQTRPQRRTWDQRERTYNIRLWKERQPTRFNFARAVDWMNWRTEFNAGGSDKP